MFLMTEIDSNLNNFARDANRLLEELEAEEETETLISGVEDIERINHHWLPTFELDSH